MNVFNKILTALRGSVREIGESLVDANATRIYEQEVVEAKQHLAQAKQDLTLVMAKQMQAEREIARLQAEVERYESHGAEALDKSQPQLAEEVAGHIASLERELAEQTRARDSFGANVVRLKEMIRQTEYKLREHERELAGGCAHGSRRTACRLLPACGRYSFRCRNACAEPWLPAESASRALPWWRRAGWSIAPLRPEPEWRCPR